MVVKLRIAREEGRQDALDAEGTSHGRDVIIACTERVNEVLDVVGDITKMVRQGREGVGQFPQATTLEHLVVGQRAYVLWNVPAEGFGYVSTRILPTNSEELLVQQRTSFIFNDMERILERYLLIGLRSRVLRYGVLLRLEIQEVQRVGQFVKEGLDACRIDMVTVVQRALYLHILDGAEVFVPQVLKGHLSVVVAL